jgi:glucose-1-phosphate cytidylyltransferase
MNDPNVMFEKEPINKLLQAGELNSYVHKGFWQPMDTAKEAQYLNKLWEKGNAPWKKW